MSGETDEEAVGDFEAICRATPDNADLNALWRDHTLGRPEVQAKLGSILREADGLKHQLTGVDLSSAEGIEKARTIQASHRALVRAFDILTEEYDDGNYDRPF